MSNLPAGVSNQTPNTIQEQLEIYNFDSDKITDLDHVDDLTLNSLGLLVEIGTVDSIVVRRTVREIIRNLKEQFEEWQERKSSG